MEPTSKLLERSIRWQSPQPWQRKSELASPSLTTEEKNLQGFRTVLQSFVISIQASAEVLGAICCPCYRIGWKRDALVGDSSTMLSIPALRHAHPFRQFP